MSLGEAPKVVWDQPGQTAFIYVRTFSKKCGKTFNQLSDLYIALLFKFTQKTKQLAANLTSF